MRGGGEGGVVAEGGERGPRGFAVVGGEGGRDIAQGRGPVEMRVDIRSQTARTPASGGGERTSAARPFRRFPS
jgi:hypothetical protein